MKTAHVLSFQNSVMNSRYSCHSYPKKQQKYENVISWPDATSYENSMCIEVSKLSHDQSTVAIKQDQNKQVDVIAWPGFESPIDMSKSNVFSHPYKSEVYLMTRCNKLWKTAHVLSSKNSVMNGRYSGHSCPKKQQKYENVISWPDAISYENSMCIEV